MPIHIEKTTSDITLGTHPAKVKSVGVRDSAEDDSQFRVWDFELADGKVVGATSSMATSQKSKAGKWIAAIIGRVPEADEDITVEGMDCIVEVAENKNGWPTVANVLAPLRGPKKASGAPIAPIVDVDTTTTSAGPQDPSDALPF